MEALSNEELDAILATGPDLSHLSDAELHALIAREQYGKGQVRVR